MSSPCPSIIAPRSRRLIASKTQSTMNTFDATSLSELRDNLRANDVRVPVRTKRRTCMLNEREIWVACRFLATAGDKRLLEFPLRVEPRDSPDLVVTMPSGRIGIEITEAVPNDERRVIDYSESMGLDNCRIVPPYRVDDPLRSRAEVEKIAKGDGPCLPQMGDSIERNCNEAILHRIVKKVEDFAKPGFTKHPRNWLLVHDNWSPAITEEQMAMERLDQHILLRGSKNPFSTVFVLLSGSLLEFARCAVAVKHPIPNEWLGWRTLRAEAQPSPSTPAQDELWRVNPGAGRTAARAIMEAESLDMARGIFDAHFASPNPIDTHRAAYAFTKRMEAEGNGRGYRPIRVHADRAGNRPHRAPGRTGI